MKYLIEGVLYAEVRAARAAGHDDAAISAAVAAHRRGAALARLRARMDLAAPAPERETVVSDGHALTRLALVVVGSALAEAGSATLKAKIDELSAALGFDALGLATAEYEGHRLAVEHLRAGGALEDLPEAANCPPVLVKTAASDAEARLARGRAVDAELSRAYAAYVGEAAAIDAAPPDLEALAAEEAAREAAEIAAEDAAREAAQAPAPIWTDPLMPPLDLTPPEQEAAP